MFMSLHITRYRGWAIPFGWFSMIALRIPLIFDKKIRFFKLMGTGKNGSFSILPSISRWSMLIAWDNRADYEQFLNKSVIIVYLKLFGAENHDMLFSCVQSRGQWDGANPFSPADPVVRRSSSVAVLTRATIRLSKLAAFWCNVPEAERTLRNTPGLLFSLGMGEFPLFRQATFSIWESTDAMHHFVYSTKHHRKVISRTRKEHWYKEELFAEFTPET